MYKLFIVYSWILEIQLKTVVHNFLIEGMTCLSHRDGCECTSVCDTHCTRPMVNHDAKLSIFMIHQDTILHGFSILKGY